MKKNIILGALMMVVMTLSAQKEGLTELTLENGLKVYLWEDHNQADVTGMTIVRAGAIDEPLDHTGLAHYLEHLLFKGTEKIGSLDWAKEKPLYDQIIALYDEYSATDDKEKRLELTKKINEVSLEASQYGVTSEFSNLIEGMGGEGLNAGTSYDQTVYYNNFPSFQMEKWLTVNADRFDKPVFRAFQAELENVFEEYNMYQDMVQTHSNNFLMSHVYEGHPYARDVIGTADHLKAPNLNVLIDFYNKWYVPSNMALAIVGNFDTESTIPLVEKTYGKLAKKPAPVQNKEWTATDFSKNPHYTAKMGYYPTVYWAYEGVEKGHEDEVVLDFCMQLLNNSMSTGLLDKLGLDGDVMAAYAFQDTRRDMGRVFVAGVPYYDINQRMYESNRSTEGKIFKQVDKLKSGEIEDWMMQSVKDMYARQYDLMLESSESKINIISQAFVYKGTIDEELAMMEKINKITKEDVQRVATKYLSADRMTVTIEEGKPKKNKLEKPEIKPLEPKDQASTAYAAMLKGLPTGEMKEEYNNFGDVTKATLSENVNMFYTKNPANDLFTLTLKYGVGTAKMPKLEYGISLLNTAGFMPDTDAQGYRRALSELGAQCSYSVSDDYTYISILGKESNLAEICKLVTRQLLFPKLDQKQFDNVIGSEINGRFVEQKNSSTQASALMEYILYDKKSKYIDRMDIMEVYNMPFSTITGEVQRASDYALDIHYVGQKPVDEVQSILTSNLPMKEGMKPTESPTFREKKVYEKTQVYFLPNSEIQQAKVYFYVDGMPYEIKDDVAYEAFNQYFSGGFNGLVMNEIREKRSMAYTAYGMMTQPNIVSKKSNFLGYVGTQSDKVADAVEVYMGLLQDMPLYPERLENIKTYLRQSALTTKPNFRSKSQAFDYWMKLGYTEDPAKVNMAAVDALTFDQITDFYNTYVKGKAITVVIMGDPKAIDRKAIEAKFGKMKKLSTGRLFSSMSF